MSAPFAFATLRAHFHELVELPESARAIRLQEIERQAPALADELNALLASTDFRDLEAPASLQLERLGPFRVGTKLGAGGMGDVFVGERVDGGFTQRVALKILKSAKPGQMLVQRFLRERQILARLQHPRIARLLDGGMTDSGQPWLAMELVEGEDLLHWAERRHPTLDQRVSMLIQVAETVAFAHAQLVIHRDLKPANILIGADGSAKLLDFGVAKLLDDPVEDGLSQFGLPMTPRYAAPEQILGEAVGTGVDVHALGVLGFELCAGHMPYQPPSTDEQSWAARVLAPDRLDLRRVLTERSGLDERDRKRAQRVLPDILSKAMALDPNRRHASAAAFADDLRDWLERRAPRSGAGSPKERVQLLLQRFRWPILLGVVTLTLILAALSVALWQAREARRQAERADRQTNALLEVLAAASPQHYAGRDPPASEFLVDAANRIHADPEQDATGAMRALLEIGNGLLNLGRQEPAFTVLEQAWQRAGDEPLISGNQRIDLLKLQALAIDPKSESALERADRIRQRLQQWSPRCREPGLVLAAETALGGVYAHLNDRERALELFARAAPDQLPPSLPAHNAESSLRERGRGLLRLGEARLARESFAAATNVISKSPDSFSGLRTAEAYWWLAEVDMDLGNFDDAKRALAMSTDRVLAEYAAGHMERFRLHVHQMLLDFLSQPQSVEPAAWPALVAEARGLDHSTEWSSQMRFDWQRLEWLHAKARQECGSKSLPLPVAQSERQRSQLTQLEDWLLQRCRSETISAEHQDRP
ncbi:hypothetical protein C7S18_05145 [Ahniella affigens]|uniref:Protein kinase domain-containing protein n=1 Tax=Ahniella affigens TaxID=2021234 RepID=A0A2P1PP54_9GAMM|nr:serine/threonine-protein kinase [Ahniella affigens]AVP96624.1 hypothetical protein C7S18_05145 [Ahniella affigens]